MGGKTILKLSNVGRKKRRSIDEKFVRVISGVSLDIFEGERLALVGPSGSGKSTLLRMMADLEPFDEGEIFFYGEPLTDIDPRDYRRGIGFVQQSPSLFDGTVSDNIRWGPKLTGEVLSEERVAELLDAVGLSAEFAHMKADALSIGQMQRVAIARALSTEPKILMMDEPTSALDAKSAERIVLMVERLTLEMGITSILVVHDLALARGAVDRLALIHDGRLVAVMPTGEFFANPPREFEEIIQISRRNGACDE
ncbi:MAG TPA: ATP-binding cassette domain-containing protein [candidate division Zixibacteria bacterium]|nr:ATP-binding cassette domain-containing protein [candidate division Zixibacteria bacterium]